MWTRVLLLLHTTVRLDGWSCLKKAGDEVIVNFGPSLLPQSCWAFGVSGSAVEKKLLQLVKFQANVAIYRTLLWARPIIKITNLK